MTIISEATIWSETLGAYLTTLAKAKAVTHLWYSGERDN
jgi:hypothetical protein